MKHRFLTATVILLASLPTINARIADGDWTGSLELGPGRNLKLVIHISDGTSITMDSPDQGAYGIACETVYLNGDSINFQIPKLRMSYAGRLNDGNISGQFHQGGMTMPLLFKPGSRKANRPQTPQPPFPYTEEEIKVKNDAAGSILAGMLTLPQNHNASTPVAILVSGSGQQNRDEELFEHKPFAVIADYLARNGIASLRYDDRGIGESTGNISNATTADFASDAEAVMKWLRTQRKFNNVGIIGHSEGGQIAYMLAAGNDVPDFIVSIAGPSIKGTRTIAYQNKMALLKSGIPEKQASDFESALERALEYKLTNPDVTVVSDDVIAQLYPQCHDDVITRQLSAMMKQSLTSQSANKWMMHFLNYDPASDMKKLRIPSFIVYGDKDTQVPSSLNYEPARRFAPSAIVKSYPELNHLMQHARTGNVEEYATIEETISPQVLADIVAFIRTHTSR